MEPMGSFHQLICPLLTGSLPLNLATRPTIQPRPDRFTPLNLGASLTIQPGPNRFTPLNLGASLTIQPGPNRPE